MTCRATTRVTWPQLVHRRADLALSKAASAEPVLAGDLLTYTLTLSNAGPSDAAGIAMTDTLPAGLLFASGSAGCTEAAGLVTCTRAELAAGAAAPVTIVVTVPSGTAEGQLLPNRAELTAAETDPDPADNQAAITTTVHTRADLELTKWAAGATVLAGESLTYTLVITNHGPSDARDVVLTDTLPSGVAVISLPAGWASVGRDVTGTLGHRNQRRDAGLCRGGAGSFVDSRRHSARQLGRRPAARQRTWALPRASPRSRPRCRPPPTWPYPRQRRLTRSLSAIP